MIEPVEVFINVFNRYTSTKALVEQLLSMPLVKKITLLDNRSTYPPLLEWYQSNDPALNWKRSESCPVKVALLEHNTGKLGLWKSGLIRSITTKFFVVADCDVDLDDCPNDLFYVLQEGFRRYPDRVKVAPGIRLDDIPEGPDKKVFLSWQARFWREPLDGMFFSANTDTHFALMRRDFSYCRPEEGVKWTVSPSLRTNRPYTVRHLPFYLDFDNLNEEEVYYWQQLDPRVKGSKSHRWFRERTGINQAKELEQLDVNYWKDLPVKWWIGGRRAARPSSSLFQRAVSLLNGHESILEVGCGAAFHRYMFKGMKYYGVDVARQALEKARENNPNDTFFEGDFRYLELPEVECCFGSAILDHLVSFESGLKKLFEISKFVIIIFVNKLEPETPIIRPFYPIYNNTYARRHIEEFCKIRGWQVQFEDDNVFPNRVTTLGIFQKVTYPFAPSV